MFIIKRSRPRFQGWKHVNLYRLCYGQVTDPVTGAGVYPPFYSATELQDIKALGFDSVRLAFRSDPMVAAQIAGNQAALDSLINQILGFGDMCISAGLLVNFDIHPSPSSVYKTMTLFATSDITTPSYLAFKAIVSKLAAAIGSRYLPELVALDIVNEPLTPSDVTFATVHQPDLYTAARAAAPHLTLIIRGGAYDLDSTLVNIDPSQYDWNTLFSVHQYDYVDFTYCGSKEQGSPIKYYDAVDYPGDGISPSTAIAAATANINADNSLDASAKAAAISLATSRLTNYYANFTRRGLLTNVLPRMRDWVDSKKIDRSQLYIGEMGTSLNGSSRSTTVASRAAWYGDTTNWYSSNNIRWGIFCADLPNFINPLIDSAFYLQSPTSALGSVCNSTNVPWQIKTALGLN